MEYYELLGLEREPFSDVANPYFMYASGGHEECLQRLEISVRLRRGLCTVAGDVGTGKTTMAQALEKSLQLDGRFCVGAIYDPTFLSEVDFLDHILAVFKVGSSSVGGMPQRMEALKEFIYRKSLDEDRAIVLILDEGQTLSAENLELVRLLLNVQAPDRRLFSAVIFGQPELMRAIERNVALADRVNLRCLIRPLQRDETGQLIDFRLRQAGLENGRELFTLAAKNVIHEATGGHPRKIVLLCQEAVEGAIMGEAEHVTDELVTSILVKRGEIESALQELTGRDADRDNEQGPANVRLPVSDAPPAPALGQTMMDVVSRKGFWKWLFGR